MDDLTEEQRSDDGAPQKKLRTGFRHPPNDIRNNYAYRIYEEQLAKDSNAEKQRG